MKEKVIVALSITSFLGIMALSTKINNNTLNAKVSTTYSSVLIKETPQQDSDDIYPEIDHLDETIAKKKKYLQCISNQLAIYIDKKKRDIVKNKKRKL